MFGCFQLLEASFFVVLFYNKNQEQHTGAEILGNPVVWPESMLRNAAKECTDAKRSVLFRKSLKKKK